MAETTPPSNAQELATNAVFPLIGGRYGVGISWDHDGKSDLDLDLQAVVVDNAGRVIDAVFYNNLKALCALSHSGDETTGEKTGLDEVIWADLNRMPAHVKMLVFVVAAFRGGHLKDAKNGKIHILEKFAKHEVATFCMEPSDEEVDVVATMVRGGDNTWSLTVIDEPAQDGRHFIDILEPTIGNIVRKVIPGAPRKLHISLSMDKGTVLDLPQAAAGERQTIKVGLGWDCHNGRVDLDVSAVLFNRHSDSLGAVFYNKLKGFGMIHSGDNTTGAGSGDDETITINLDEVPMEAEQIFFIVNIYSRGWTFRSVANPYCRILDSSGTELARYKLREATGHSNGLIMARSVREEGGRWGFQAIGASCSGNVWSDSISDMKLLFGRSPRDGFEVTYSVGETAEVSIIEGAHAGNWLRCRILGPGSTADTYNIHILPTKMYDDAGGFSDHDVPDMSKDYLRKAGCDPSSERPGVCGFDCAIA